MGLLRRAEARTADVGEGFVATEAPALQATIVGTLSATERRTDAVATTVRFERGASGRVVVVWRNRNVGFAPAEAVPGLLAQLGAAGRAGLAAPATVLRDGGVWRVRVGPPPAARTGLATADELEPPPYTVFGVPLGARFQPAAPGPGQVDGAGVRRPVWVLAVDDDSWDVRDGLDADLVSLRERIAASAGRGTVHLRLGDDVVELRLGEGARVTLTSPGGVVEKLHPAP